jgi:hypothetical protein
VSQLWGAVQCIQYKNDIALPISRQLNSLRHTGGSSDSGWADRYLLDKSGEKRLPSSNLKERMARPKGLSGVFGFTGLD